MNELNNVSNKKIVITTASFLVLFFLIVLGLSLYSCNAHVHKRSREIIILKKHENEMKNFPHFCPETPQVYYIESEIE